MTLIMTMIATTTTITAEYHQSHCCLITINVDNENYVDNDQDNYIDYYDENEGDYDNDELHEH